MVSRILVYRLGSLGDMCVALPVFNSMRKKYPNAEITLLTNLPVSAAAAPGGDLISAGRLVDKLIYYPLGLRSITELFSLWKRLRRKRFDLVIDLAVYRGRAIGIRKRLFFGSIGAKRLIGNVSAMADERARFISGRGIYEPEVERLMARVQALNLAPSKLEEKWLWDLHLSAEETHLALQCHERIGRVPFLAVSAGTKIEVKDWGDGAWLDCLKIIAETSGNFGLIFFGAASERERSERLALAWSGPKLIVAGELNVRESAALLARAALFLGHDSGPMHLAASVGVRCVAVFSARNLPGQWFPYGGQHTVFYHQTPCFGCGLDHCSTYEKKCIRAIPPRMVAESVAKHLGEESDGPRSVGCEWIDPDSGQKRIFDGCDSS